VPGEPLARATSGRRGAADRAHLAPADTRHAAPALAFIIACSSAAGAERGRRFTCSWRAGRPRDRAVSLMLTVTWSAAGARESLGLCAPGAGALGGRGSQLDADRGLAGAGASSVAGSCCLPHCWSPPCVARGERRFDVAVVAYVAALAAGVVVATLGVSMAVGLHRRNCGRRTSRSTCWDDRAGGRRHAPVLRCDRRSGTHGAPRTPAAALGGARLAGRRGDPGRGRSRDRGEWHRRVRSLRLRGGRRRGGLDAAPADEATGPMGRARLAALWTGSGW
jgi:hypothetical protein